jgi:hypothetical protein
MRPAARAFGTQQDLDFLLASVAFTSRAAGDIKQHADAAFGWQQTTV